MINEKNIRKLARTVLFEMHMGPSNSNQGEFTDINYGMYNQHGPVNSESSEEVDPVKVDYVATVQVAEPTYDIVTIEDDEVTPSSARELKSFVNAKIDNDIKLGHDIDSVWKKIKSTIEEFSKWVLILKIN